MPARRAISSMFGPEYGSAPYQAGERTAPPLPPPDGKPPMRLPIAGESSASGQGGGASAARSSSPIAEGDQNAQLVQMLQIMGLL